MVQMEGATLAEEDPDLEGIKNDEIVEELDADSDVDANVEVDVDDELMNKIFKIF